jgi:hypothetical protein
LSQTYAFRHPRAFRILTIAGLGAILAGVAAVSGPGRVTPLGQHHVSRAEAIAFANDPDKHGGEGPVATAAQEQYENRAYPNDTVDYQQVISSQQAYQAVKRHGKGGTKATAPRSPSQVGSGAANSSAWTLIGPTADRVDGFLSYTPADGASVISSGRVAAIAIAPDCNGSNCRVWVGAAGGGIWATSNGLAATPAWHSS